MKLPAPSSWLKLALIAQFIMLAWVFYPAPSTNGDNAKYYILGTALAELKGYRQIHLPNEPVEKQYPILFPLFLGIINIFSHTVFLSKIILGGCGVLVTLLCFYYCRNFYGYLLIPFLFCMALSAHIAEYSVILMSEVPYMLLTLAALYAYQKSLEQPENKRLFYAAILLAVLPMHCRSVGISFSAAFLVVNLFAKRYRYALVYGLLLIVTVILYRAMTSWDNPYVLQLFLKNSYDPEMGYATMAEMVTRIMRNITKYSTLLIGNVLVPLSNDAGVLAKRWAACICTVLIVLGWLRMVWSPLRIIPIYIFFYLGILSLWQTQWTSERFLVSIIPFLYFLLVAGLDTLLRIVPVGGNGDFKTRFTHLKDLDFTHLTPGRKSVLWIGIGIVILANTYSQFSNTTGREKLSTDWKNFYSCADWIRLNTPDDAVIVSRKAELLYLRAKRKGVLYPFTHDVDQVIETMRKEKVTHIVFDNFFWTKTTARYLFPAIKSHSTMFKIVYAVQNPDFYVLEFVHK